MSTTTTTHIHFKKNKNPIWEINIKRHFSSKNTQKNFCVYQEAFLMPARAPFEASSRNTIRDIRKTWYTPRDRPVKMHRFLRRVKELFRGNLASLYCCCSLNSGGSSGSLRKALNRLRFSSNCLASWRRWLSWMLRFSLRTSIAIRCLCFSSHVSVEEVERNVNGFFGLWIIVNGPSFFLSFFLGPFSAGTCSIAKKKKKGKDEDDDENKN